ncbi:MAG TPA: DMT family transporter [Candidatus Limnocylindrales bacterium]|nr:DMT family transporter [Candidatus Limnocylindrales bacterium]
MGKNLVKKTDETIDPTRDQKIGFKAALLTLFLCLLWGGNGVATKISLQGIPPLALAGFRFGLGFICIALWALWTHTPLRVRSGELYPLTLVGLLFILQISFLNLGLERTLVIYSTTIFSIYPLMIALLAHCFIPGDQLVIRNFLGFVIAFLGIIVLFVGKFHPESRNLWLGNLFTLFSSLCLSILFVYTKKIMRGINPVKLLFWQMVYGVPGFFLLSFFLEKRLDPSLLTSKVIGALLYQGVIVAGFCFIGRNLLLKRYPASKLSAFFFTNPLFGIILSVLILHEPITRQLLVGGSLIACGIYLANSR